MRFLAIVPARAGSKGVPKKNVKLLANKPLVYYTIDAAKEVFHERDICLTTDSQEIMDVAKKRGLGIPFQRPIDLARDNSGTYEVLLHAVAHYEDQGEFYDAVVLLQPTSPLRKGYHIKEAMNLFSLELDMVVSVSETKSNPYYVLFEEDENGFLKKSKRGNFIRRQDCPKVWEFNGAVYVINVASLKLKNMLQFTKIVKYEMDEISSIDIDTELDFKVAELFLNQDA